MEIVEQQPQTRRDFLYLVTGATAAIGVGATAWPFIDQMEPSADTLAAGAPIDVDLTPIAPGQMIRVRWRGAPIFIVNRPPKELDTLKDKKLAAELRDPESQVRQQPTYAENWSRSVKPEYGVYVGICTHLGCIPQFFPEPSATTPVTNWPGGFFCPCHGSKYDLAGRVYSGVPAPYNLPVPPYRFASDTKLRIGENPPGVTFEMNSVVQM
ncbi:MAG TPA: ubiquinol-cytochrome c reductase iron-sulfur subunit [Beijerinckiaceae bacterium]|nr:ubiquinol-cytochrome c reductase iron-sulfur subunit [Methylobacteriaceae bacterium]MCC0003165.1 ubiquinol-cytochrome c reductase iron-sulfur subunit [Methylobacteriaceae bacterium]MCO5089138.1 ubiquinol-cytochrome c reductase iron-sulfur subunit [Methylobacteriaceae bacterium]HRY03762.1 ubiquinol-cytochrome c reductase iron-sulfur subunit [Beijerinckiaceae bacterium]